MRTTAELWSRAAGSLANLVAFPWHATTRWRQRVRPADPRTSLQLTRRYRLRVSAQAWRSRSTSGQRSGWSAWGLSVSETDSLGQTRHLSPFGAFCAANVYRGVAGQDVGLQPPTLPGRATFTVPRCAWYLDPTWNVGYLFVFFHNADAWHNELGGALLVQHSRRRFTAAAYTYYGPWGSGTAISGYPLPPAPPWRYQLPYGWLVPGKAYAARFRALRADGRFSVPATVIGLASTVYPTG